MITNPYKVLGVPDSASEDECTRAYKALAKKYHPDLNPNNAEAERKMAEINAAYDQIKNGAAPQFNNSYGSYHQQGSSAAPDYLSSAAQFIRTGQYQQAINLLNNIDDRNGRWYYLSAIAHMSLGNVAIAQDHIRSAYAKDPNNRTYQSAYTNIMNGVNPLNADPFVSFYGGYNNYDANQPRRTYTIRANRGCVSRIIRFFFIIFIIRLVLRLIFSASYSLQQKRYTPPESTPPGYTQQYDNPNSSTNPLGESDGETYNQ